MRINQNISAMNTYSRLTAANNAKAGSLAKLSSGLRINRAGDDAAGLAISEKMRGQVGGLKQSVRNAQDGISLIQTAEGALNETHSILNRMRELAVQSSNDTNTFDDRQEIQKEMDQLATEMTRIADDTQFNTQNLLGGKFSAKFHIGANKGQNMELKIGAMDAGTLKVAGEDGASFAVTGAKGTGSVGEGTYDVVKLEEGIEVENAAGTKVSAKYALVGKDGKAVATSADGKEYNTLADSKDLDKITEGKYASDTDAELTFDNAVVNGKVEVAADGSATADATVKSTLANGTYTVIANADSALISSGLGLVDDNNQLVATSTDGLSWKSVSDQSGDDVFTVETTALVSGAEVNIGSEGGINVSTQKSADAAIKTIDEAISNVSAERSKLGATQNRLDHTINNLTATAENLSEAESRIRDVDMAEEMMAFTKNNILSQAATSMLAQANQMPQSVLQLLQ